VLISVVRVFEAISTALLEDLEQRGLLEQTLVVCMGEFGRAPQVALEPNFAGSSPGLKHWASVYSIVMAGAGVIRGGVVGASDRIGAYPVSNSVGLPDLAATMFSALGVDPGGHYTDPGGRPFPISTGKPVPTLYG
jgi:arylsulfatase A-like enzyme